MKNQFLVFDWKGFMAHFRQFDANSSSLSYSFPPPTVIMGMLAGILGIERDQYYTMFAPDQVRLGVQIRTVPRKIMQTVNYIFAKSPNDLNMSGENLHTQIPVEFVVAKNFPKAPLHYRIAVQCLNIDLKLRLQQAIEQIRFKYLPYLGSAPFGSWLEWPGEPEEVEQIKEAEAIVDTVVDLKSLDLQSISLDIIHHQPPAFFKEHMRRNFDQERIPGDLVDIIWERNRGKIKARFTQPIYQLLVNGEQFMVTLF